MWKRPFAWYLLGCILLGASRADAALKGPLGYWKFDEGQGDVAADSSGNENDGEIRDAEWVKGPFGTALRFDGKGACVTIPEIAGLDGSDEMTVEAWVYWEGTGKFPNIVTGGTWSPGGFLLFVQDHRCSFRMGRPGVSAASKQSWRETSATLVEPFALGRWYHLAATFKRPEIKTYVDGQPVGSAKWDYPVGYHGDLRIGQWGGAVSHQGLIDEVRIFDRALGAEEIAADYRKQAPARAGAPQGQKAYEKIPRASQWATAAAIFENEYAKLAISPLGRCTALLDKRTGEDRILRTCPLVTIKRGGKVFSRPTCSREGDKLTFRFAKADTSVVLDVKAKPNYFVFCVESVSGADVEETTFVRLQLKRCEYVQQMSGLAGDDDFSVCLRTLDLPTFVRVGGNPPVLSATATKAHGLKEGRAALVACPTARLKQVLQELVRAEGLPYSPLGGPFARDAEQNRGSYVFARVSERDVDRWIDLAQRGGIRTIHLSGWQQSLGHYEPRKTLYSEGLAGLKGVVDRFHAAGLTVGIHTLTGCIGTNDPWVRPVPDRRLATDGTFTLAAAIGAQDATAPTVEAPGNYPTVWAYSSRGNCIRIDDELILYAAIANESPFGFSQCRRGAFGTKAAPHKKGAPVHHMYVRYGCFVPDENSTLVDEIADAIARVYNTCGLDQIYMDGAEAMRGWYGIARMRHAIFTRLKRPALVEASCWGHHSWPFHSRVGAWDHPKWGLKRFADDHLRAVAQYRRGCLLEAQLGWWVILGPARDWDMEMPDEIEYLCAKALGHDVPLSFQNVSVRGDPSNARQKEYFTTIGRYERLRLANYFSEAVKERLRRQRREFRLARGDDARWQLVPTDYLAHKVTGPHDGTWTATNRFAAQPVKLRIGALYAALPYDDPRSMALADFSKEGEFSPGGAARHVTARLEPNAEAPPGGPNRGGAPPSTAGRFAATNQGDSPEGAWARVVKPFDSGVDLTRYDAIGLWVHGDGQGELLNLQLTNRPEYFRTLDDHYIKVDFTGWRYFELLLRERDAAAYHDYTWPYGAHCVLHRSPLVRHAVNRLTVYLNNLPPKKEVACYLGPVRALRTRKVVLHDPTVEINGRRLVFPVDLTSGMYIEFESPDDCRVYDERGHMVRWLRPQGETPSLRPGDNRVVFACQATKGFRPRAEVTVIATGEALRDRMPKEKIDWSLLRRCDEYPRTICELDDHQNRWRLACRPEAETAAVEIELKVDRAAGEMEQYNAPDAVTIEDFEPAEKQHTFHYDAEPTSAGCLAGVTQRLSRCSGVVKVGKSSACYRATSTLGNPGGWSVKGRRFAAPIDLSGFAAIGFWLHGDAGGESFKFQLHDADGGWQDMVTHVNFNGWRFCRFALGGPHLKNPHKIDAVNIYYNGIPAGKTVTCHVDGIRAMRKAEPLRQPSLIIAGRRITFPVAMDAGDVLAMKGMDDCKLYRHSGAVEDIKPEGAAPKLDRGQNPVVFTLANPHRRGFRAVVTLTTKYP